MFFIFIGSFFYFMLFVSFKEFISAYNLIIPEENPVPYYLNNQYFRENLTSLLKMYQIHNEMPGYLNKEEAYSYLMWVYEFYGKPVQFPNLNDVRYKLNSKPFISFEEFVDFIEPYYGIAS